MPVEFVDEIVVAAPLRVGCGHRNSPCRSSPRTGTGVAISLFCRYLPPTSARNPSRHACCDPPLLSSERVEVRAHGLRPFDGTTDAPAIGARFRREGNQAG